MGDKGGKNDMERVGLFQEMTYVTIGDKYRSAGTGKKMIILRLSVLIINK